MRGGDGAIALNPDVDYQMRDDDEILILADDDSTVDFRPKPVASANDYELANGRLTQSVERELIIGWTKKAPTVLEQYADYVIDGSVIDVMLADPKPEELAEIAALNERLDGIEVSVIHKSCLNTEELLEVEPFRYDNIIILAEGGEGADHQAVDSENIVTLLLLRDIFKEHPEESASTKLITEVLNSQNYPLVAQAGVKDIIISNRLISMMLAQISASRDIKRVYDDIFEEDGSEIYLKPARLYFKDFPAAVTYADMIRIAQKRKEVCLGVKIRANERDVAHNCGVTLIPPKDLVFTLTAEDSLVVLSEDEL